MSIKFQGKNVMTTKRRNLKRSEQIQDSHFEDVLEKARNEGDPLFAEYNLLYEEYRALTHRLDLLDREKHHLQTQLVEMNRSLDLATRIDPMTGLANRRDIMEKIERESSRAERHKRTFSIMIANLDNFKLVNDTHGYDTGDDVLSLIHI